MRAEKFSGYEGLKLVDLPKPAVSDGKVLLRMTAAGVTPLDHTILSGHFPHAKAPLAGFIAARRGQGLPQAEAGPPRILKQERLLESPRVAYGLYRPPAWCAGGRLPAATSAPVRLGRPLPC